MNRKKYSNTRRKVRMETSIETRTVILSRSNLEGIIETFLRTGAFRQINADEDIEDCQFDITKLTEQIGYSKKPYDGGIPIILKIKKKTL